MKDRIFTATEIVKALWQVRADIEEMELYRTIGSAEAGSRRVALLEVADTLDLEATYADYEPQPEAGNSGK